MIIEDLLSMKLDDNRKLKSNVEKHRNTEFGDEFESFDLFEKTEFQKLRSSKQRKNVKLGQQRKAVYNQLVTLSNESELFTSILVARMLRIGFISEKIGKNSNKIQRLRTLIQQEKTK